MSQVAVLLYQNVFQRDPHKESHTKNVKWMTKVLKSIHTMFPSDDVNIYHLTFSTKKEQTELKASISLVEELDEEENDQAFHKILDWDGNCDNSHEFTTLKNKEFVQLYDMIQQALFHIIRNEKKDYSHVVIWCEDDFIRVPVDSFDWNDSYCMFTTKPFWFFDQTKIKRAINHRFLAMTYPQFQTLFLQSIYQILSLKKNNNDLCIEEMFYQLVEKESGIQYIQPSTYLSHLGESGYNLEKDNTKEIEWVYDRSLHLICR
ncbi:MAG: hypothetical protein AABY22_13780, partial [Nanoarchaeota archaeon]